MGVTTKRVYVMREPIPAPTDRRKLRIEPGQFGTKYMPYSEACLWMRIAGKRMRFQLVGQRYHSVQLYDGDCQFSMPITLGEAGIFTDSNGYYYYPDNPAG